MSADPKQIITEWWISGCDFDTGVSLYLQYGHNKVLKNTMPGRPMRYTEKLKYELCKDVDLDWLKMPLITGEHKPRVIRVIPAKSLLKDYEQHPEPKPEITDSYPDIIRRVINEYAEYYRERSMRHSEMADIPPENTEKNCSKRAELLLEIKKLSARMDLFYFAKQAYIDHKEMPDEQLLWPGEAKTEIASELPDNIDDLRVMKKNIQISLVKDRNLLDYQQTTKLEKKRPMPDGPRRKGIEKRIVWKMKRIEEIDYKIVDLT